jgi:hypothetical protein
MMADDPDAVVNIAAELRGAMWTLYAIPEGEHTDADRLNLGSGVSRSGIMFPTRLLKQFWDQQQEKTDG